MTKKEIDLISSRGLAVYNQTYTDEYGVVYIGLKNGRIIRDQVSVSKTATVSQTSISTAANTSSSSGVTSVQLSGGTGISIGGVNPITSSGVITVTNTDPDQTVSLTSGTGISTSGTYPNFTITNTLPDIAVNLSNGTGINITGSYPNFTITNSGISGFTSGSVIFAGASGSLAENNLDFYWDFTNKRLRIGNSSASSTTTPPNLLTLYQTAGNHSILLCGQEYTDPTSWPVTNMNGILFTLGTNRGGNRQLWIGDSTALGNTGAPNTPAISGFFRYLTGNSLPSIDAVRGDGTLRMHVNIGTNTTNTAVGFEWTGATGTTFPASRLTIYGNISIGNSYIGIAAPTNGASIEGNVIIGTSTDSGYKLDVNGTVRAQGKLTLGNSIIASGSSEGTSGQVLTSNGTGATPSWTTIGGTGTVTSVATSAPITGGTITGSGTIGITQSTTSTDGYLSSTDWNTFNGKQDALTLTTTGTSGAATLVGSTLNIPDYSGGGGGASQNIIYSISATF